jgi:hypothetical protein
MFSATFLGNHGWLISSERSRLLVDPLLFARYGWTESVGLHVWPPRKLDLARLPPIDAVLLTHEHEGHFDIASLHLLDREIPIYLSSRSSLAMREAIGEMGFAAHPVEPGTVFSAGDLDVLTMPGDQLRAIGEEWDNLAHVVYDRGGHGSLFTPVDVAPTRAMWRAQQGLLPRPGLWAHTNNYSNLHFQHRGTPLDDGAVARLVANVMRYHRALGDEWAPPEALLVYGGGFCFGGERAFINREMFPCDAREAASVLARMLPGERVIAPIPGETLTMCDGKLVEVSPCAPFMEALPPAEWPARGHRGEVRWLADFGPACERSDCAPSDLDVLVDELRGFAGFLYANFPFRRLYSLRPGDVGGRRPTVALRLRTDAAGATCVLEYQPQACRFHPVDSADPAAEYLMVYECWATDLLALLRGEIASPSLALGRSRHQSAGAEPFDLDLFLMEYAHPLRQPARFLALYRRLIAAQGRAVPRVRFAARRT